MWSIQVHRHNYNELCQIHIASVVSKALAVRWQKKFKDGFTSLKDGSRPGQPKTVATNANIADVAGRQTNSEKHCS